jgi:hypothetical protein
MKATLKTLTLALFCQELTTSVHAKTHTCTEQFDRLKEPQKDISEIIQLKQQYFDQDFPLTNRDYFYQQQWYTNGFQDWVKARFNGLIVKTLRSWSKELKGEPEGKTWISKGKINSEISLFGTGQVPINLRRAGEIGDAYFLAACAAMAERSDRVKNMFTPMEDLNNQGFVTVNMFIKGVPVT